MKVVLSLIASCLMAASLVASVPDQGEGASNTTLQTFRQPKNIAFSVFSGGSSHANWALSIIEELSKRGHATIFLTKVMSAEHHEESSVSSHTHTLCRMATKSLGRTFPQ